MQLGKSYETTNCKVTSPLWSTAYSIFFIAYSLLTLSLVGHGQVTTTTVQDTVYNADGSYAQGAILISWPAFVTATGDTVVAGNLNVNIGNQGNVVISLAPNIGASPSGSYYTAVYHLNDGTVSKEYWSIPNVAGTNIATIRSLVMPASIAVQTITATEVTNMLGKYLPLDGGTLSGSLQLSSNPQSEMQAATKNYVDTAVTPLLSQISSAISAAPKTNQVIQQPSGTMLSSNVLQGKYYASGFQNGSNGNGIENITSSTNCTNSSPEGLSGCTVYVEPDYANTENPQGYGSYLSGNHAENMDWPFDTHVHDERNGVTADYYENPLSLVPYQSSGQTITANYTYPYQDWPAYGATNLSAEYLQTTDYAGGINFYNYFGAGQPAYFFKPYYGNLQMAATNYSSGQMEAIQNNINCHGTGDCIGFTQSVVCDGGLNSGDDEGCHGGDFNVSEDPVVYKGTVNSTAAVGATIVSTSGTAGQGTQGQDRLLVDTTPSNIITGSSITGYSGSQQTGANRSSANVPNSAVDSNANYPVSTMVQLCYAGNDNGAGGVAGCVSGSQPTGFIPSVTNQISPSPSVTTSVVAAYTATAPQTGLPSGFCTPQTLQSTNPAASCYLPTSGIACVADQEEYETVNYTYSQASQQIILLNMRFPHLNGLFFAHGGLCGYAVEQQSDVFTGDSNYNGISQVFPVEGSSSSTTFYYISQRVNLGYSAPVLGLSNDQGGVNTAGGAECFTGSPFIFQLQSDNHTVVMAMDYPFEDGTLSILNGLTVTINTPNPSYNGSYVMSWGTTNSNGNEVSYYLPSTPTGAAPTSGTATFCNTNYKLYPSVRVNSVLNTSNNQVDGTMNTMPSPVQFTAGDTVMEPHYPWIYTGHDAGRGINQYLPRFYGGGYLYGMTYNFLLSGSPFIGFAIENQTDQNRYLRYGGTHEAPGFGYFLSGEWLNDLAISQAPESAVINVQGCKPAPIGCTSANSAFNVINVPGSELNYDPKSSTWTFGYNVNPNANPPIPTTGQMQAYNISVTNELSAGEVGVSGAYLFNIGGAVGITNSPASPVFNNWFANYAYGFGAQNTKVIDGYLYRGASANSINCGTGTGDTSCTFVLGTLNAGSVVNSPAVVASSSISTPTLTVGGGSSVTHIAYYGTGTITPVAVAAQTCSDQTFTVNGLAQTDAIGSINPAGALGNITVNGYASGANTLTMHFCNVSSGSVVPPAGNYTFLAMH